MSLTAVRIFILGLLWLAAIGYSFWWSYQGAPDGAGFPFGSLVMTLVAGWHLVRTAMRSGDTTREQLESVGPWNRLKLWFISPLLIFFSASMLPWLATDRLQHKVEWAAQRNLNNLDIVTSQLTSYISSALEDGDADAKISRRLNAMISAREDISHIVLTIDGKTLFAFSVASEEREVVEELLDLQVARFLPEDVSFTGDAHRDTFHGVAHNVLDQRGEHRGVLIVAMDLTELLFETRKRVNGLLIMSVVLFLVLGVFGVWTLFNLILGLVRDRA